MSAATDRWRETRSMAESPMTSLARIKAGDTLAAILDRIEQEAEDERGQPPAMRLDAWAEVLRIIREGS